MLTAIPAPPELYYSNLLYFFTKNEEMQWRVMRIFRMLLCVWAFAPRAGQGRAQQAGGEDCRWEPQQRPAPQSRWGNRIKVLQTVPRCSEHHREPAAQLSSQGRARRRSVQAPVCVHRALQQCTASCISFQELSLSCHGGIPPWGEQCCQQRTWDAFLWSDSAFI